MFNPKKSLPKNLEDRTSLDKKASPDDLQEIAPPIAEHETYKARRKEANDARDRIELENLRAKLFRQKPAGSELRKKNEELKEFNRNLSQIRNRVGV